MLQVVDLKTITTKSLPQGIRNRVGKKINALTNRSVKHIPLAEIFEALAEEQIYPIDIDGTPWQGMLLGRAEVGTRECIENQRATIQLAFQDNRKAAAQTLSGDNVVEAKVFLAAQCLQLTWGRIGAHSEAMEVVAYVF